MISFLDDIALMSGTINVAPAFAIFDPEIGMDYMKIAECKFRILAVGFQYLYYKLSGACIGQVCKLRCVQLTPVRKFGSNSISNRHSGCILRKRIVFA